MSLASWRFCASVRPLALARCTATVATMRLAMLTLDSQRYGRKCASSSSSAPTSEACSASSSDPCPVMTYSGRKIASIRAVSSTTPPVAVVSGVTSRCTGRLSSTASPYPPPAVAVKRTVAVPSARARAVHEKMADSPAPTCLVWVTSPVRVTPSTAIVTVTSRASSVPFRTSVRSDTSSPTRRNRGSAGRTSSGCVTSSSLAPCPTSVSAVTARACARQVVALSGSSSSKLALPSASVTSCPIHSAVFWKLERTCGSSPASSSARKESMSAGDSAEASSAISMAACSATSPSASSSPAPFSPSATSSNASFWRSTETASDEAVRTPRARSNQNAVMPSRADSARSDSTAWSTTATDTSASTPLPSESVTRTS